MKALLNEFGRIVEKGGPETTDYSRVNRLMDLFGDYMKKGELLAEQLPDIWNRFGDVFSLKTLQGHVCRKPHGYAGDFEIIENMYLRKTSAEPHLVTWDNYFLSCRASRAVRNRKEYFKTLLAGIEKKKPGEKIHVLNIGSGPGRDMYEYFTENPGTRINIDSIDMDKKAVKYAELLCEDYLDRITFYNRNALRFRPKKSYDLIWSAGLFDYLNDKVFMHLIDRYSNYLKPEGVMVIGSFSTRNPCINYMELAQWSLNHRTEDELSHLARRCGFNDSKTMIDREPEGINLFLHMRNSHV